MYVFGEINKSSTTIESNVVNYAQNLTTASAGVKSIKIVSGSISESYWNSLNVLFFTSGSPQYLNEHRFGTPSSNVAIHNRVGKQFLTKYHGYPSSSLITIPSCYFGEKIKEKTFQLTDLNNTDNDGDTNPIIKDDGFGNLYATNANSNFGTLKGSSTSISSSDHYVGNIFYDKGLVVITETGSWSGSVNYSDLATNYTLKFESYDTITSYEYDVNLLPQDYNYSTNYTLRSPVSGSGKTLELSSYLLATEFTGSDFQPYITKINLYDRGNYEEPVIQATLPKPIRKSDKVNMRFKIKLDM
tara:strand:+ start:567 stop:1469 length:903 start_codon:yes stop_codon:yes gene_type:complete